MMQNLDLLLTGAIALASFAVSIFFFKYWQKTWDRFFLFFSAAFLIDSITRFALGLITVSDAVEPLFYIPRLLTFALIIAAIIDKNRAKPDN